MITFWILLFLPLVSFIGISLFGLKRSQYAAGVSIFVAILNALIAYGLVFEFNQVVPPSVTWLQVGSFTVSMGFEWDRLTQIMLLVVTWIGALIHIYAWGYMKQDESKARFFAYLSLFMFSMLGIVLAGNLVMMFIFWELVGLSSYLLIGFWYQKPSAADAGKKAFLVNKIGDFGFLLGILWVWTIWKTFDFASLRQMDLKAVMQSGGWGEISMAGIVILLFCGTLGKSAQFPLHVWLPDAMEGPTPVSALIHAATMVAAGVYMLCRIFFMISLAPGALEVMAWVGGITSVLAALWAIAQDDIKRILAYSTLSQLGYMVMAVGLGSPASAMFHLSTHASFKALLFLGAGSVIVGLHHEQNIWRMGGIWRRMRWTSVTFLIGLLALCGWLFTAGALSKDEILVLAYHQNKALFYMGIFTAILTSFYMGRLFLVAFLGEPRSSEASHAHENTLVMVVPLVILAGLSFETAWKSEWVDVVLGSLTRVPVHAGGGLHGVLMFLPAVGLGGAFLVYGKVRDRDILSAWFPRLRSGLASKFYFDEIYAWVIKYIQGTISWFFDQFEKGIIDGFCNRGGSLLAVTTGNFFRCFQSGNLQTYVIFLGLALVILLGWFIVSSFV